MSEHLRLAPEAVAAPTPATAPPRAATVQSLAGNAAVARQVLIQRELTGNPAIPAGTVMATPDELPMPQTHSFSGPDRKGKAVIRAGKATPVLSKDPPAPALLWDERPDTSAEGQHFDLPLGLGSSFDHLMADKAAIFRDGGPTADDVQQVGLGDCYDLSLLASIVASDPGIITRMITPDGNGGATVSLWHETYWGMGDAQQEQVKIDSSLLFTVDAKGAKDRLKGAAIRAVADDKDVTRTEWWAEVTPSGPLQVLWPHRRLTVKAPLWVALFEKAHARFAETYGTYGTGGAKPTTSGYDTVGGGGFGSKDFFIFYGDTATATATSTAWKPDAGAQATVRSNRGIIRSLLGFSAAKADKKPVPVMTAESYENVPIQRTDEMITALKGTPEWTALDERTRGDLEGVQKMTQLYEKDATGTYWSTDTQKADVAAAKAAVAIAAQFAVSPSRANCEPKGASYTNELFRPGRSKDVSELTQLLVTLAGLGTDTPTGQRGVITSHAYSVRDAAIRTDDGKPVDPSAPDPVLDLIDIDRSTVTVQNPHHTNEPDEMGNAPAGSAWDGKDDGVFDVSLARFIRDFSALVSVTPT